MALDPSKFGTGNPETRAKGGGLPTGFYATCVDAFYRPRANQEGRKWLSAELIWQPDEGATFNDEPLTDPVEARYSSGALTAFAPSKDGETVVDWQGWNGIDEDDDTVEALKGCYALRTGSALQFRETNWTTFMDRARDLGDAHITKLAKESFDIRDWVGVHGRLDRLPQAERKDRAGNKMGGGDMLCLTQVTPGPAVNGKGAGASKAAAGKPATKGGAIDAALDEQLQALVIGVLGDTSGAIHKLKLTAAVKQLEDEGARKAGMKRIVDGGFLQAGAEAGLWKYHAENGTVEAS